MADQTLIYNLALAAIGTRTTVASPSQRSPEALALNTQWDQAVRAVLQAAQWNFARVQAPLALLADATLSPPGPVPQPWLYEYAYPSDCVAARYIMPVFYNPPANLPGAQAVPYYSQPNVRFIVSADRDQDGNDIKVILCDQPSAVLVYTRLVTNISVWDDLFVTALAEYLGARVAAGLTGKRSVALDALGRANATIMAARASNGNEGITVNDIVPDWVRVRGFQSDWAYPPGGQMFYGPQALTLVT